MTVPVRRLPTLPVMLAGSAAFLDLYATQPLLPLLARTFHASTFDVGLTITAPTVAVALTAPGVGRLADTMGLRRVIVSSAALLALATVLAATSMNLNQLIFWRFVQGVATPGIFASTVAYIHQIWPPSRVGRATAAYMTGTVLGGFTGRAVAGLFAADVSWRASFLALAILNGGVAVALWIWLPSELEMIPTLAPSRNRSRMSGGAIARLFANRRLVATFGVGFCVLFTQVAMFTYVTFHVAAPPFNLSPAAIGWLFVVYLVGAAVTPLSGRWIDHYGHRTGIASAMAIGAGGALLTLLPWLGAIIAGLALAATGVFVAQVSTSSYIGTVTEEDRGLAVGLYSTFYYAGGSFGAALPSAVWKLGGWPGCVALAVFVQAIGVAVAFSQWVSAAESPGAALPETGV